MEENRKIILDMQGITKIYNNGFVANNNVNFSCFEGEIHALVGENGAGKTTLMKILFGLEDKQEGKIFIDGKEAKINNPLDAIKYSVGMVHQHFMLVPSLTVAENIVLGLEPKKHGCFDFKEAVRITEEVAHKYNFNIDAKAKINSLSVGVQQKVEILKSLVHGAKVVILDEPTAVLTPQETVELFGELKNLKAKGHTVVFISHKLDEIMELCDRVTVLKNGKTIATDNIENLTKESISRMMVGRDVMLDIQKDEAKPSETRVRIRNLTVKKNKNKNAIENMSFDVRGGEIIGIAGVEGNGQNELANALTGMGKYSGGTIEINGENIANKSIKQIRDLGVAHISENRMRIGCSVNSSIKDNIIADRYRDKKYKKGIIFNDKLINKEVDDLIKEFNIKCDDRDQELRMLSGGNVQKVVVAREFSSGANVIVANQPTRGIDVGATEFIRDILVKMTRERQAATILISADLNEVIEVSDSLLVFYNGKIAAYFPDSRKVNEELLGEYMLGLRTMSPEEIGGVIHEN